MQETYLKRISYMYILASFQYLVNKMIEGIIDDI